MARRSSYQRLIAKSQSEKQRLIKNLLRTLRQIDQERKARVADLDDAQRLVVRELAHLGHAVAEGVKRGPGRPKGSVAEIAADGSGGRKKRIRRSLESLKEIAEKMVAFIQSKGDQGASGREMRAEFGPYQSFKVFVKDKAGVNLKTKGQRSQIRYFVA
jgi:hypothetical protein